MQRIVMTLVVATLAIGLGGPSAWAQFGIRDAASKANGAYSRQSGSRTGRAYRAPRESIVRTERAPASVAQGPTEQRSYSVEPRSSTDVDPDRNDDRGDRDNAWRYRRHNGRWWYWLPSERWAIWADGRWILYDREDRETYRSYSYEPSERVYRAPARGGNQSRNPAWFYPKTDPRRYQ